MQYYQVFISSGQAAQANRILDALMAKQLVLGGPVLGGPAKFLCISRRAMSRKACVSISCSR